MPECTCMLGGGSPLDRLAFTFSLISDASSICNLTVRTDEMMDAAIARLFSAIAAWEMAPDWKLIMKRSMDSMRRTISMAATRGGVRAAAELEGGGVAALEMEPTLQRGDGGCERIPKRTAMMIMTGGLGQRGGGNEKDSVWITKMIHTMHRMRQEGAEMTMQERCRFRAARGSRGYVRGARVCALRAMEAAAATPDARPHARGRASGFAAAS